MSIPPNQLGLSLSGGGYRATAFHLGTLNKLNEMGILSSIDVISTISGGSIAGAAWGLHEGEYQTFHEQMINSLNKKSVIRFILTSPTIFIPAFFLLAVFIFAFCLLFTRWAPFSPVIIIFAAYLLANYQFKIFPVSRVIEKSYDKFFFAKKTLNDLKDKPVVAIGSSNLHTGRPFTFSKLKMSDSTYVYRFDYNPPILFLQQKFPVSKAVMASSCVPFAFTPVRIAEEFYAEKSDFKRINPQLVDGGVYDNQGIQKITQPKSSYECSMIITSDAGGNFLADIRYPNTIALLIRTVDLFMTRIKNFQMTKNLFGNSADSGRPVAYLSLGWVLDSCIPEFVNNMINGLVLREVIDAHKFDPEWVRDPKTNCKKIEDYLKARVNYPAIRSRGLSKEEWDLPVIRKLAFHPLA